MADKYELPQITDTYNRLVDPDLTERQMRAELETPIWVPEIDQMIAIADSAEDLLKD